MVEDMSFESGSEEVEDETGGRGVCSSSDMTWLMAASKDGVSIEPKSTEALKSTEGLKLPEDLASDRGGGKGANTPDETEDMDFGRVVLEEEEAPIPVAYILAQFVVDDDDGAVLLLLPLLLTSVAPIPFSYILAQFVQVEVLFAEEEGIIGCAPAVFTSLFAEDNNLIRL